MKQSFEMQQQVSNLKAANDKLIRKYVAEKMSSAWNNAVSSPVAIILIFVPLGIFANLEIHLRWPVIIAFWLCWLLFGMCDIFNAYPISKGSIIVTPANKLRQTLLNYCKRDRITTAICLPLLLGVFIWLAYELRLAFKYHFFSFEMSNTIANAAFWITIIIGIICALASLIVTYYVTPKKINELVAEIDELNGND